MTLTIRHAAESLAWGGTAYGALQFARAEALFDGCSICGPWGCSPPPEAMIAAHGFWLIVFAALAAVAVRALSPRGLRRAGRVQTAAGLLAAAGVVGWALVTWRPESAARQKYVVQRTLFVFATLVNVPAAQATLAGAAVWAVGSVRVGRQSPVEPGPATEEHS